ncbi:MAG TPA: glycosyltransferase family 4 protein [Planctomycetota bacterium]|nr:glycosyltransferase family 4 protein [Planctomycetota bacterium]
MKLLFLTQVLDERDAILGFVSRWVRGFGDRCEAVRVIALEVGAADLPDNVDWRAVGRRGRLGRWLRYRRFLDEAFAEGFDTVLAHMVPRYALVAAAPARRAGAGLFLWYTHAGVDRRLRQAVKRVDKVFTASDASLRLESPNKVVTGHGIDLDHFPWAEPASAAGGAPPRLLAVGRMTPAKDPITLLDALAAWSREGGGAEASLELVGGGLAPGDGDYGEVVRAHIEATGLAGRVHLAGDVPYPEIPPRYRDCFALVSASRTGSVDKVVLEAMATGRPVVTSNESFPPLLASLGAQAQLLQFPAGDAAALAQNLARLAQLDPGQRADLGRRLREIVAREHGVEALLDRLVHEMQPAPRQRGAGARP